jgi:hypothetical protein
MNKSNELAYLNIEIYNTQNKINVMKKERDLLYECMRIEKTLLNNPINFDLISYSLTRLHTEITRLALIYLEKVNQRNEINNIL